MILNRKLFEDLLGQNGGKKILMGLCISYLQERLMADKNPLLRNYNPEEYRRLAYYSIEKNSVSISEQRFKFGEHTQPIEMLLEREIDKKREE